MCLLGIDPLFILKLVQNKTSKILLLFFNTELCVRSLNSRRFFYQTPKMRWNTLLEEDAQRVADQFLARNATAPLNVSQCYLAFVQTSEGLLHCEDALHFW